MSTKATTHKGETADAANDRRAAVLSRRLDSTPDLVGTLISVPSKDVAPVFADDTEAMEYAVDHGEGKTFKGGTVTNADGTTKELPPIKQDDLPHR